MVLVGNLIEACLDEETKSLMAATNYLWQPSDFWYHLNQTSGYCWWQNGSLSHCLSSSRVCMCVCVLRYPVVLKTFSLRYGSGGAGRNHGGDGVVREMLFRQKLQLSVLTERRARAPYGLAGNL